MKGDNSINNNDKCQQQFLVTYTIGSCSEIELFENQMRLYVNITFTHESQYVSTM
jgi:hypothetical protein